jgi:class 3 adenylate cyclase
VAAQVRIAPGERVELELELAEGAYRLRGPQLAWSLDFRVQPSASAVRWDFPLAHGPGPGLARVLQAGRQILTLTNDGAQELLVRVERTASREDAVTAAAAASLALFRELFPAEVLAPGQLARVANVTLLVTDLHPARDLNGVWDDAKAFERIQEHCLLLKKRIAREGGALVKTLGEGVLAVVPDPVTAVQVGLDLQSALAEVDPASRLGLRLAIHRGPAMAATLNDHLDYYGATVRGVSQLLTLAEGSEMILSQAVAADLQVAALLRSRAIEGEVRETDQPGWPSGLTPCLVVKGAAPPLRS